QAALQKAETAKHDRNQDLAHALEALDERRHHTAERIKQDPGWQAAEAAVGAAEKIGQNADEKAKQAEADLAAKRKPYEDEPLLLYLWRRKHGLAEDRSGRMGRFFEPKVARFAGSGGARANLAMLRESPG